MLRTGDDYLRSLDDGRRVYIGGELVTDVTSHPAFRNTARAFASLYDRKRSPEHAEAMSYEEDGERFSFWFLKPRTQEDLRKRTAGHAQIARWTYGLLGRSPDLVAGLVTGVATNPGMLEGNRPGFGDNLTRFYDRMRRDDLFSSYVMIAAKGGRNSPDGDPSKGFEPALQVVKERDDGVVIRGSKILGTASVFSDVVWVGNLFPLAPNQTAQAVTCAVPMNAPGLTVWARRSYEKSALGRADSPFSSRFDESDSVLVFDDVLVPWESVFLMDDTRLSRDMYFQAPAHVMSNHQAVVRFLEKLRIILGIAYKAAEMNAVVDVPAVRDTLSKLAASEAALKGMISGSIADAEATPNGFLHVNRRELYAALYWCTNNYAPIAETVRELLGVAPVQMPADSSFFGDDALVEQFDQYWASANSTARERKKFVRLAWDYLGSEFAGRHAQYERFYAGPQFVHTFYNYGNCPWADYKGVIDGIIDDIPDSDLPVTASAA